MIVSLSNLHAEYVLARLGDPPFIDSVSTDRERAEYDAHVEVCELLERELARRAQTVVYTVIATPSEDDRVICAWFALCDNPAAGVVQHPSGDYFPSCQRCVDKLGLELIPF